MRTHIDKNLMEIQELKDFNITVRIMTDIFKKYGAKVKMDKTEIYSPYDANMIVKKNDKIRKYTVEIKERNSNSYDTMPLKVKKYCNIMESTKKDEIPLAIYLVNDHNYYIYNLRTLDLNKVELKNWTIPKIQFTENQEYEKVPTFFLPINLSIYHGTYANNQ